MSRASDNANAVVSAVTQTLDLYRVKYTREQSRAIMVPGVGGRMRPMFFGQWTDDNGVKHNSGRADILARPRIRIEGPGQVLLTPLPVPLWIECKAGKGRLTPDQQEFRHWVESNGDYYLLIHDDIRPLLQWLDDHSVKPR